MTQPQPPPDPFGPMHANSLSLLETLRTHRAAGANWLEVTILIAAMYIAAHVAGAEQQQEGQQ